MGQGGLPRDDGVGRGAVRASGTTRGGRVAVWAGFGRGGEGSVALAGKGRARGAPEDAAPPAPRFAYELTDTPEDKVLAIAKTVYGASDVAWTAQARKDLAAAVKLGGATPPGCQAQTHLSPSLLLYTSDRRQQ